MEAVREETEDHAHDTDAHHHHQDGGALSQGRDRVLVPVPHRGGGHHGPPDAVAVDIEHLRLGAAFHLVDHGGTDHQVHDGDEEDGDDPDAIGIHGPGELRQLGAVPEHLEQPERPRAAHQAELLLGQAGIESDPEGQDADQVDQPEPAAQVLPLVRRQPDAQRVFQGEEPGDDPFDPDEPRPGAGVQAAACLGILQLDEIEDHVDGQHVGTKTMYGRKEGGQDSRHGVPPG